MYFKLTFLGLLFFNFSVFAVTLHNASNEQLLTELEKRLKVEVEPSEGRKFIFFCRNYQAWPNDRWFEYSTIDELGNIQGKTIKAQVNAEICDSWIKTIEGVLPSLVHKKTTIGLCEKKVLRKIVLDIDGSVEFSSIEVTHSEGDCLRHSKLINSQVQ